MHALLIGIALAAATGGHSKAQRFDFDKDEVIEGGTPRGEGEALVARKRAQFESMIRLRTDFRSEMLKSAENVGR
jgi:hypothetical protein